MGDVLTVLRWLVWTFSLSLLGWVTPLHAASQKVQVFVDVVAPKECGYERAFWAALNRRSQRLEAVRADAAEVEVRVQIHRAGRRMRGSLRLRGDGSGSEPRIVVAETCQELVEALALTVALSLDPEADTSAARPAAPSPVEASPVTGTEAREVNPARPVDGPATTAEGAAETTPPPPKQAPTQTSPASPEEVTGSVPLNPPPPVPDAPLAVNLGASFAFAVPLLAVGALGGDAYFAISRKTRTAEVLPLPMVELGAAYVTSGPLDDELKLSYALWFAEVNACLQQRITDAWGFTGCLSQQAGQLTARGQRLASPEATQRLWLASGLKLELMYSFSRAFAILLNARGHVPWMPQIYEIGTPPQAVTRTSTVVPAGGLTLLLRP